MAAVTVQSLRVTRGETEVLHGVDLHAPAGSLVAVVGASGSGKSTLLRAIAGLEDVTAGRVLIGGDDVTSLPPRDRGLAMVSQSATLHPHLDVAGNLAFPLQLRKTPAAEVERRVEAEARAFGIRRLLRRRPRAMSVGERHTASMAHAMVRVPRTLLMDEPLAALDVHRRTAALHQLVTVQAGSGATIVLATNDQAIAAAIADTVVVLDGGAVRGTGTYGGLYERPPDTLIAELIGPRPMNLVPGLAWVDGAAVAVGAGGATFRFHQPVVRGQVDRAVTLGVRPEHLEVAEPGRADGWSGTVALREFAGSRVHVHVDRDVGDGRIVAVLPPPGPARGDRITLVPRRLSLFDHDGAAVIHVER